MSIGKHVGRYHRADVNTLPGIRATHNHNNFPEKAPIKVFPLPALIGDCFDQAIDDFVDLIRCEGRKAFELAKSTMKAELVLQYESERQTLIDQLSSRQNEIEELRCEIAYVSPFHLLQTP